MENKKESAFYILSNKDTLFIVIRDLYFKQEDIKEKIKEIEKKEKKEKKVIKDNLYLVFDFENLSKRLDDERTGAYFFRNIIYYNKYINMNSENKYVQNNSDNKEDNTHLNIVIKNCVFNNNNTKNFFFVDEEFKLNKLIISDELYSMSPYIDVLFEKFKPKIFVLKKFKINSKLQLENFVHFIIKTGCEELVLDDIFIELIIKKDEKDESYDELTENYFSFENGEFFIIKDNKNKKLEKLKKLKMTDCPLFAIKKDTFKNINKFKDISIDINENSLLNPSIITKFKINKGYSDICFDLDSFKLNDEANDCLDNYSKLNNGKKNKKKDYLDYLDYIFDIIINNKDNYNFKKLKFKNFDITKYEYITGENLTFIDENNWVLNDEESEKKKNFEKKDEELKNKINNNLDKLSNIKELIFDNCSNHFIALILKFINSTKNELDYLKIKKCGKEYFDLKNILSLNITNLILFDTPLIIDHFPEYGKSHLECFDGELGGVDNLTININSLEHYCIVNNLDYFRTIEIIVELINNDNFNKNLCFEMNALPIIMTFLVAKELNKNKNLKEKYIIPADFNFQSNEKRQEIIEKENSPFILKGLENKEITIKKHNIKNKLTNFYILFSIIKNEKEKFLEQKNDFGNDSFDLDIDYRTFFIVNKIKTIILKDTIFDNNIPLKIKEEIFKLTFVNLLYNPDDKKETNKKNYKIDIKTLNDIIYKNPFYNFQSLIKYYLSIISLERINPEQHEILRSLKTFIDDLKYIFEKITSCTNEITIVFDNIKERKQFYCLLCFLREVNKEANYYDKSFNLIIPKGDTNMEKPLRFMLPDKNGDIKRKLDKCFLKEPNEENKDQFSVLNYYYMDEEEKKLFGEENKGEVEFDGFKFKFEYSCKSEKDEKLYDKLFNDFILE